MQDQPNVLVIDDDENILSAFKNFLDAENCNLISVPCINGAIANLLLEPIELLIMNVNEKMTSDSRLCKYVRKLRQNLPIIIITSYPDIVNEKDAYKCGADYFFVKPLDLNKLRYAVRKCLELDKVK